MQIEFWTGPPVETHGYLVADPESGEAWAVDAPLDTAARVLASVEARGWRLTRLILTHAHFDHFLDAPAFTARGVPISLHPLDEPLLAEPQTEMFGVPLPMPRVQVDERLNEGQTLTLGGHRWEVWHVPGHAPGHVLLHSAATRTVLGGDLLFHGAYGRTDLPGSDPAAMAASLLRLLELPDDTRVFPGHGPAVTLGDERAWLEALLAAPTHIQL